MSKCSRCQNDFTPLIKNNGLPYKTCDRCRYTDDKYRDKHKEQIKVYRDQYYLNNQDKIKEYREVNKDKIQEQRKQFYEVNKDKISTKLKLDRITCECDARSGGLRDAGGARSLYGMRCADLYGLVAFARCGARFRV